MKYPNIYQKVVFVYIENVNSPALGFTHSTNHHHFDKKGQMTKRQGFRIDCGEISSSD